MRRSPWLILLLLGAAGAAHADADPVQAELNEGLARYAAKDYPGAAKLLGVVALRRPALLAGDNGWYALALSESKRADVADEAARLRTALEVTDMAMVHGIDGHLAFRGARWSAELLRLEPGRVPPAARAAAADRLGRLLVIGCEQDGSTGSRCLKALFDHGLMTAARAPAVGPLLVLFAPNLRTRLRARLGPCAGPLALGRRRGEPCRKALSGLPADRHESLARMWGLLNPARSATAALLRLHVTDRGRLAVAAAETAPAARCRAFRDVLEGARLALAADASTELKRATLTPAFEVARKYPALMPAPEVAGCPPVPAYLRAAHDAGRAGLALAMPSTRGETWQAFAAGFQELTTLYIEELSRIGAYPRAERIARDMLDWPVPRPEAGAMAEAKRMLRRDWRRALKLARAGWIRARAAGVRCRPAAQAASDRERAFGTLAREIGEPLREMGRSIPSWMTPCFDGDASPPPPPPPPPPSPPPKPPKPCTLEDDGRTRLPGGAATWVRLSGPGCDDGSERVPFAAARARCTEAGGRLPAGEEARALAEAVVGRDDLPSRPIWVGPRRCIVPPTTETRPATAAGCQLWCTERTP